MIGVLRAFSAGKARGRPKVFPLIAFGFKTQRAKRAVF